MSVSLDSEITGEGLCPYCGQGDCQCPSDDEYDYAECPKCGGTGLEPEGFDCDYCDGYGEIEI
jgi:hypothetical protein